MKGYDDRGQIYTIEGFASALILVGVLFFIFQSISVVTPQTEMSGDMKLSQKALDTLAVLDWMSEDNTSVLKNTVAWWNGGAADPGNRVAPGETNVSILDRSIAGLVQNDTGYSLEIVYNNGQTATVKTIIYGGVPGDDSVVATRLVTLNANDGQSGFWKSRGFHPQLIEVRLISWYL